MKFVTLVGVLETVKNYQPALSRGRHRNPEQSEKLIEFMQLHKNIALGNIDRLDRERTAILWKSLTKELNAVGPPFKKRSEWRKAWTDWKQSCQRKLAQPEDGSRSITDHEQIIIQLCGWTPITIKEYESDDNSNGSTTSSDTPLKIPSVGQNSNLQMDPLKEESLELQDTSTSEIQLSNTNSFNQFNKRRHRNSEQAKILLDFMSCNKDIANVSTKERGHEETKKLWKELTAELNAFGPPVKSVSSWKKTWADWKMACKKKLALTKSEAERRGLSREEQMIIELCDLNAPYQCDDVSNGDVQSSSNSSDTTLAYNADAHISKKRKLKEESLSETYDENIETDCMLETTVQETPNASTSQFTEIERTLIDVRAGVVSIQTSLQELCRLMAEQNQELKRFFSESRRHHFVMEKEMIERKRERMK